MAQLIPLSLTVPCFSKIQIGFTFLISAHPGSPGYRAVKRVCVCVSAHPGCSGQRAVKEVCVYWIYSSGTLKIILNLPFLSNEVK